MTKPIEPKPCPFCGGEPMIIRDSRYRRVGCLGCGCQTQWHNNYKSAVTAWNRRTPCAED